MNFLKELKNKPEIQRQAFFVRANQIIRNMDKNILKNTTQKILKKL